MKANILKKYWYLFVLLGIVAFSFYIRSINIAPDRILSFDPIFQYRFTKYLDDWGHLPIWDELSYYVGRMDTPADSPLLWYVTAFIYLLVKQFGISLFIVASYSSAIYGALIVIPAFLLGNELSNKYGGLMAAIMVGTAPQILIRTFGSSYDTDQFVVLFILLTVYLGLRLIKNINITNFSLALLGFTAFMLAWNDFAFTFFIILGFVIIRMLVEIFHRLLNKNRDSSNMQNIFKKHLPSFAILFCLSLGILVTGFILNQDPIKGFLDVIGFAQSSERWIVNISIAELQPFDILNLQGWIIAMGNFVMGVSFIDIALFLIFIFAMFFGIYITYKKDFRLFSAFITILLIGVYITTKGIRFTEFSSAFNIILVSVGLGYFVEYMSKRDLIFKTFSIGLILCIALIVINIGQNISQNLGPDINSNWDSAWNFLKTETPEMSIIGTWWDPGHMIAGIAERRNFADGAHCASCKYTINDRITDLGKIMATNDENESLRLIRKYQGDSPKVYWIASDDLIAKWRWPQYFGTGCDGTEDPSCPLYIQIGEESRSIDNEGNIVFRNYGSIIVYNAEIPIPILVQGINAALFDEIIIYSDTDAIAIEFTDEEKNAILEGLKPLERQLNVRFANETIPMTVWIPRHFSYIVVIPPHQRNNVFTKMFFLEGQGLENFKQVFRNEQVKIYEVIL
jgi:asparagine N-glycosylation enzyme membrane subunit Stt3